MKIAAIDIGTNTILMTLANIVSKDKIEFLGDYHEIARLGEGLKQSGFIAEQAINRASDILEKYRKVCEIESIERVLPVATNAMRIAKNANEVKQALSERIGAEIEIISGETEAFFSFLGAVRDEKPSLVIDIGGGSTEIIAGRNQEISFRKSMQIGAVTITESIFQSDPPDSVSFESARRFVRGGLSEIEALSISQNHRIYAVAGTPTTLAQIDLGLPSYNGELVEGHILKRENIEALLDRLKSTSAAGIVDKFGIHPGRADLISAGALILFEILRKLLSEKCLASARGLRYGVVKNFVNYID